MTKGVLKVKDLLYTKIQGLCVRVRVCVCYCVCCQKFPTIHKILEKTTSYKRFCRLGSVFNVILLSVPLTSWQIPGRWEVFIDQLRVSALEDCLTFYESNMAILNKRHDNGESKV